jgi:Fe-S oxidoreductase
MLDLLPHDEDAKRLHGQFFALAEFLTRQGHQPAALNRKAVVHGHCHQKAIIGLEAEKKLFHAMGIEAEVLDDGCCGMAGSFGFEQRKYGISAEIYKHRLGPRLSQLPPETLVLADGFSCKTQIEQATGRRPLHLAQVVRMAQQGGQPNSEEALNGSGGLQGRSASWQRQIAVAAGTAGLVIGAWYLGRRIQR